MRIHPAMAATEAPPVMEARRWIEGVSFPAERPLLNVSQAAPVDPPPQALREAIADFAVNVPEAHLYGPVLGLPDLREAVADEWRSSYGGDTSASDVAITSGCNQAFAAAMSTIAGEEDEVILPTPWYFNHKMWLDMMGVETIALQTGADLLPDPERAARLITSRTRAIVLVTPNNPGGVEYPAALVQAFFDLARHHNIALILDETYRDFDARTGKPHGLFDDPDWGETLIQLYSFSKAYRLTGHRVGALVTSPARLAEIEKFLDTVTICPNQLGQIAALWGMQNLGSWLAEARAEILKRRAAIHDALPVIETQGWRLLGCGAYFAYLSHPFAMSSAQLAPKLVREASVLLLPGTMSYPKAATRGTREVRIAFANVDSPTITSLFERLSSLGWPLAQDAELA